MGFLMLILGYFSANILQSICSPWILPEGQSLSFECKKLSLWNIELEKVQFTQPELSVSLQRLRLDYNCFDLILKHQLNNAELTGLAIQLKNPEPPLEDPNAAVSSDFNFNTAWLQPLCIAGNAFAGLTKLEPASIQSIKLYDMAIDMESRQIRCQKAIGQFDAKAGLNLQAELDVDKIPASVGLQWQPNLVHLQLHYQIPALGTTKVLSQWEFTFEPQRLQLDAKLNWQWDHHSFSTTIMGNTQQLSAQLSTSTAGQPQQVFSQWHWKPHSNICGTIGQGIHQQTINWLTEPSSLNSQTENLDQNNAWNVAPQNLRGKFNLDNYSAANLQLNKLSSRVNLSPKTHRLQAQMAELQYEQLKFINTELSFPFTQQQKGFFKTELHLQAQSVLVEVAIERISNGWQLSGNAQAQKLPLPQLQVSGYVKLDPPFWPRFEAIVEIPQQALSLRPDELSPDGPDGSLQLNFASKLRCAWSRSEGWQENFKAEWKDGFYSNDDFSMMITGLYGHLHSDRLSSLATGPAQLIGWKTIKGHGFNLQAGKMLWQWEKEQRFFLETLRTKWCQGYLNIQPIRLQFPIESLDLSLFCENLQLDDLLREFQIGEVEGQGVLGGHINAVLTPQAMTFKDAYLYSSPATTGQLKILESQIMDLMINRQDQPHLRLVREALRDYSYQWAKVQFDAEGQDLILRLSLDGKPNRLLPFRFDEKTGLFHYEVKGAGTHLQGLKLNTNLRSVNLWPIIQSLFRWSQKIEF
jgi:hypothetical protein